MRIETAAQQFLQHLTLERGCTVATAESYASDLRRFTEYLGEAGIEADSVNVDALVVRQYVSWLAGQGYSSATIRRRVSGLSSLWKWLIAFGYAVVNPCGSVLLPKKRRRMPAVLTLEEAQRMLKHSDDHPNPRTGFRNRAVISVLLYCGLRRAEVTGLKVGDVDLRSRWLKVRKGKGLKGRAIPLVEEVAEAIADWLEFRPEVDHQYLFTGQQKRPLGVRGVDCVFRRMARDARVARDGVTPHTLRHTFATLLLQQGCDLASIQEMLGHADLSTTSVYLHLDASHLRQAAQRHPLNSRRTPCTGGQRG